jgi:mitogen-activated protein kinase kinase kinase
MLDKKREQKVPCEIKKVPGEIKKNLVICTGCRSPGEFTEKPFKTGHCMHGLIGAESMLLGNGGEAFVYKRDCATAVKQFRNASVKSVPAAQAEILFAINSLVHPHLVRVLEFDVAAGCLSMEFVNGGSLADLLLREGALTENRTKKVLIDIVAGLCGLHEHNLLHRDVKPANVMLDWHSGASKLTDWIGSWAEKESLLLGKPVGTPVFMAPEVAGKPHKHQIVSDTWSLGCTVINMASGRLPWADTDALGRTNEFMAMWLTSKGKAPPYNAAGWSPVLTAFVAKCFEPDPNKRACSHELSNICNIMRI